MVTGLGPQDWANYPPPEAGSEIAGSPKYYKKSMKSMPAPNTPSRLTWNPNESLLALFTNHKTIPSSTRSKDACQSLTVHSNMPAAEGLINKETVSLYYCIICNNFIYNWWVIGRVCTKHRDMIAHNSSVSYISMNKESVWFITLCGLFNIAEADNSHCYWEYMTDNTSN